MKSKGMDEKEKDLQISIKNLEVKVKILEILLSRHIENYSDEILKIYWDMGKESK